MARWPHAQWW